MVKINLEGYPVEINRKKLKLYSPDSVPQKIEQISVKGKTLEFVIPALDIYDVVVLN